MSEQNESVALIYMQGPSTGSNTRYHPRLMPDPYFNGKGDISLVDRLSGLTDPQINAVFEFTRGYEGPLTGYREGLHEIV